MNPTNDYIFHRIFGHVGNEEITAALIGTIINQEITNIKIDETPITEQNIRDEKVGILDIKARLNNNTVCDVEMQVVKTRDLEKRIMFYWSKLYSSEIHSGEKYKALNKAIVILIANFEINRLKEIPNFHTKWQIREEKYRKIVLTDTLEIHIIELPKIIKHLEKSNKIKKNKEGIYSKIILDPERKGDRDMKESENSDKVQELNEEKLILWSMFLSNPELLSEEDLEKNEDIKKAKEQLEKIKENEKVQRLAELRMKYILDQDSIRWSGFEDGKKAEKIEIVKKLIELKMPIQQIIQVTGLTEEEIKSI